MPKIAKVSLLLAIAKKRGLAGLGRGPGYPAGVRATPAG
jgi:hypothetical protein